MLQESFDLWVAKHATSHSKYFCGNVAKQVALFCCLFYCNFRACLHGVRASNRVTWVEGLAHSLPLHATHLTGSLSVLHGLSFEWPISTTNKMADQRNFFHLISAFCTGMGLFSARDSSITLISSD